MSQYQLAIGTIVKDDVHYLREWIEYHLLVGFEHVYIWNHDAVGGAAWRATVELVLPYVERGLATFQVWEDTSANWQMHGWADLIAHCGAQADWLALTDADAFFYPVEGPSVAAILAGYEATQVAGLAVYCSTFGSSGLVEPPPLQTQAFLRRAQLDHGANWTANYILRPANLEPSDGKGYNIPRNGAALIDTDFVRLNTKPGKRNGPLDVLRLNHYSVRSKADWDRKCQRGWPGEEQQWADSNHTLAEHKFAMLDRNEVYDDGMLRFGEAIKKAMGMT